MSPIHRFESAAFKAYCADGDAAERAHKLEAVASAIESYLMRVDPKKLKEMDPWKSAKAERAIQYLKKLKDDVAKLATRVMKEPAVAA